MTDSAITTRTPRLSPRRRRLFIGSSLFMALLVAGIIALPYGIQYGMQRWLLAQDLTYAKIEDIEFNPFTGKLLIKNLQSGNKDTPYLHVAEARLSIDWLPMFKSRFYFNELLIKGAVLNIEKHADGRLRVGVFTIDTQSGKSGSDKPVQFGTQKLRIVNSKIKYLSDELQLSAAINQASTGQLLNWEPTYKTPLEIDGKLNEGQLHFNGNFAPFARAVSLDGQLQVSALPLTSFNTMLIAKPLSVDGYLTSDVQISVSLPTGTQDDKLVQHTIGGSISLQDFSVDDSDKQINLWRSDSINFSDLRVTDQQILEVAQTEIQHLVLARHIDTSEPESKSRPALAEAASITLQALRLSELHQLSIKDVAIQGATINLHRSAQGQWLTIQDLQDSNAEKKTPPATEEKLAIEIGQISVGANSVIHIRDQMVTPAFQSSLNINKAVISHLDNSKPAQVSELLLNGKVGDYFSFSTSGHLQAFAEKTNLELKGEIKNMDLPPFSSYANQHLGYFLKSGQMDSDIRLTITNDVIDGNATLQINNLQVSTGDPARAKVLTTQLSMPLETALAMLRDDNKDIKLQIPVTGNIHDPSFNYSDAINQAIAKATKTAAISYLKYALGPFGLAISISQIAGDIAASINLEPVVFDAGKTELDETDISYLQHIAGVLTNRPQLRINLCGTTVPADRAALLSTGVAITEESLPALATQRADRIKEYLVKQHRVAPERLFICHPETLTDKDAPPQVRLLI